MKYYALIVAGGSGLRMGADTPKQFLVLDEKPILMHTLEKFAQCKPSPEILLVLPESSFETWKSLLVQYTFDVPHLLVAGGETRIDSVRNGLQMISNKKSLVAIHDGVRPFVTPKIIEESFAVAKQKGSAITCIPLKDSIRLVEENGTKALDRQQYRLVQTPQTFATQQILQAYQTPNIQHLTDDASVWEASGRQVTLIHGSYENIKITTPEDMKLAQALLE
jgi:2-C-methyl-D-erythritol 4-phosphate cytidylyltransferase